jgi:hypothetical protein
MDDIVECTTPHHTTPHHFVDADVDVDADKDMDVQSTFLHLPGHHETDARVADAPARTLSRRMQTGERRQMDAEKADAYYNVVSLFLTKSRQVHFTKSIYIVLGI